MTPFRKSITTTAVISLSIISADAVTIASADFNGRTRTTTTTTNDTASNLNWTLNGISTPGDLTAVPNQALTNGFTQFQANGLFQTSFTQNAFFPNLNIHNEGSYYVDVPLSITHAGGISLTGLSFTGMIGGNTGFAQGSGREVDYRAEILDSGNNVIGSDNINGQNAFVQNQPPVPTTNVSLDFGGVTLSSGTTYNVRIYVGADDNRVGNNAGLDDLVITGDLIPEPGTGILGMLSAMLLLRRRR